MNLFTVTPEMRKLSQLITRDYHHCGTNEAMRKVKRFAKHHGYPMSARGIMCALVDYALSLNIKE